LEESEARTKGSESASKKIKTQKQQKTEPKPNPLTAPDKPK